MKDYLRLFVNKVSIPFFMTNVIFLQKKVVSVCGF